MLRDAWTREAEQMEENLFSKFAMGAPPTEPATKPAPRPDDDELLSSEQLRVVDLVLQGHNVFFTGEAGTGKSTVTRRIIAELKKKYGEQFGQRVAVAAMTGIAATHIGGSTLNSALGLGVPTTARDFRTMFSSRKRLREYEVLILDESSMCSADMFDRIEEMLRSIRGGVRPAGGLQIVLTGDMFQLPPIETAPSPDDPPDAFYNRGYIFESAAWKACKFTVVLLTKVFRQSDAHFSGLLNAVRHGGPGADAALAELFSSCSRELECTDGIAPTLIFPRNAEVDAINASELAKLPGPRATFVARDDVSVSSMVRNQGSASASASARSRLLQSNFFKSCQAPPRLELAVGAQVMLVKNLDTRAGLVNGSRGVVVGVSPPNGATVQFRCGTRHFCGPVKFTSTMHGLGEANRTQVPLKLAWALSAHKSQGCTLDYAKVDLRGTFAAGQAYVALSRARTMDGLQIVGYDPGCARTDPAVVAFHSALRGGSAAASPRASAYAFVDEDDNDDHTL